jgi:hypothetical protein
VTPPLRINRLDILIAELCRGEKCGHAALAAVLGISMREASRIMPLGEDRHITQSSWRAALTRAGRKWRDIGAERPAPGTFGLVCLCFDDDGPAHAIAVWNDGSRIMVFDNHSARWLSLGLWESLILPIHKLMTWSRDCWIHGVIEIERK